MELTVYTFDHFKSGQEIQEYLGYKPLASVNIGLNHVLNGDDWSTAKSQHHSSEWNSYAMYYLQAEQWVSEGKLYFKRDGHILKVIPDGNTYCCVGEGFVNLQESDNYAFGDTFEEAIENFKKKIIA
ncbi:hypothetical protein [Bacteroides neonati]|uniref:hypothetical protein n=1 Tax=Bacteroides neonati TaxID=1347393 RepID=UPI0005A8175C|nr:hypothetical protein [Bacteroides neonati]